ncbi:hypothetical protein Glove_365g209 [Diversispora epigaea]|uniref:SWIM-type domain-containing protein n=1 Tax=Diversispora epigaea TaxID=1348612 RepID=A0A397H8X6_9GLOM|nr:hypothetical protein Glove_365g209 [Diversispora epigaea]
MNNFQSDNGEGSSSVLGKRKADKRGPSNTESKRKKAKNKNEPEKRAARIIKTCNKENKKRIERALTEFLHLVGFKEINPTHQEYSVLGPTGHVYTAVISSTVSCSCPDFSLGFHCKHLFFVFLKVLKINSNCYLTYQKALITPELRFIFKKSSKIVLPTEKEIEKLMAIASIKRKPIDGNCSVCMEPLNNGQKLIWCQSGCGNNIHQDCFSEWTTQKVTCVYCRTEWKNRM